MSDTQISQQYIRELTTPFLQALTLLEDPEVTAAFFQDYEFNFQREQCSHCSKYYTRRDVEQKLLKCSGCEATYHRNCAKRLKNCKVCQKGQLGELNELEKKYFQEIVQYEGFSN